VLSPMIYPSHFFGMDGYALPGDAPEHFISTSMARFQKVTEGSGVVIRPWLQAFAWKTKTYSPDYIRTQVSTAKQQGGIGFLLWNARNDYSKPFAAMPVMTAAADRYFGKRAVAAPVPNVATATEVATPAKLALPESSTPVEQKSRPAATPPQKAHH
jgi:Putative glycosyl hydrolase domain